MGESGISNKFLVLILKVYFLGTNFYLLDRINAILG